MSKKFEGANVNYEAVNTFNNAEEEAKKQNTSRPFIERVINKNKITAMDILHEEAIEMDKDRTVDEEETEKMLGILDEKVKSYNVNDNNIVDLNAYNPKELADFISTPVEVFIVKKDGIQQDGTAVGMSQCAEKDCVGQEVIDFINSHLNGFMRETRWKREIDFPKYSPPSRQSYWSVLAGDKDGKKFWLSAISGGMYQINDVSETRIYMFKK